MHKIVHIITRLDMGGSAQNTLLNCHWLSKRYEMVLVHGLSLESQMTDREKESVDRGIEKAEKSGVKVLSIPSLIRRIDPVCDLRAFISLLRLLIHERPAIVHTHTSKTGLLGRWAAKMAGVPIIVHTPHGHVFYGHFGNVISRFFLVLEKITSPITDVIIALTEGEKNDYTAFSVLNPDKIITVHSGVDTDRFVMPHMNIKEKKRSLGLDPDEPVVAAVGWLLPIKGPEYLLKSMADIWPGHPEARLVFAGKGELEDELKAETSRMGVSDKVLFLGWRDDIPEIMQIIDVFVLPSLNEGMGRVLVEAMAAGKPVVASRTGGIPDLIKNGKNGFLVKPGDINDLSFAINRLLADRKLRDEMGNRGRAMARNFGVEKMVEKIDGLYCALLSDKKPGDRKCV